MANYKEINWDIIRTEYVTSNQYPSFDELSGKYNVSKPLLISKANDREDAMNSGLSWVEQREKFIARKRNSEENAAIEESKKMVKKVVGELNNIGLKVFKLVNRDLDNLLKLQEEAIDNNTEFPINRYVKLADVAKIAESLHKLTGSQGAKEMVLRLEVGNKNQKSLADLSDEELEKIDYQIKTGQSQIIAAEFEEV